MLRGMKTHAWVWMGGVAAGLALSLGWAATACTPETRDYGKGGGTSTSGGGGTGGAMGCPAGSKVACYEGPAGTKGIGNCREGQATCDAEGKPGVCEGQVLPVAKVDCSKHEDQDCDGVPDRCPLDFIWAGAYGVSAGSGFVPPALGVGPAGAIVLAGPVRGQVDFGLGTLASSGNDSDIYLAKFDPAGKALWQKKFGDSTEDQAVNNARVDDDGNIVVVGEYRGSLDGMGIQIPPSQGSSDAFVAKLDPMGNPLWARWGGDMANQTADAVAIGKTGDVVVVGRFDGTFSWNGGGTTLTNTTSSMVIFVQRFDKNGNSIFSTSFSAPAAAASSQSLYSVAVDINDDVVLTGDYSGGLILPDGKNYGSAGESDVFVVKLDGKTGGVVWSRSFGTANDEQGYGVATDSQGNILLSGKFEGMMSFGGNPVTTQAPNILGVYLTKLSPSGDVLWAKGYGGGNQVLGMFLQTAENDSVLLAGAFDGTMDFGGGVLKAVAPAGKQTAAGFLAKLDAGGNHIASRAFQPVFGDPDAGDNGQLAIVYRVAATPTTHEVLIAGFASGQVDLGGGTIGIQSGASPFLGKFAP